MFLLFLSVSFSSQVLSKTNVGTVGANFYAASCDSDGCGNYSTIPVVLGVPDAPTSVKLWAVSDNEVSVFVTPAPTNDGGTDILNYNMYDFSTTDKGPKISITSGVAKKSHVHVPIEMCFDGVTEVSVKSPTTVCGTDHVYNPSLQFNFDASLIYQIDIYKVKN